MRVVLAFGVLSTACGTRGAVSPDSSWEGRFGRARVVARDVAITVPAGHFESCIRVEENDRNQTSTTTASIYCPEVGLVSE